LLYLGGQASVTYEVGFLQLNTGLFPEFNIKEPMKFALTFENVSKTLTAWSGSIFDTVDAAVRELNKVRALSAELGCGLGAYYAVTPVLPLPDGTLRAEDGREVQVQLR
jgi:hypothetical protein